MSGVDGSWYSEALPVASVSSFTFDSLVSNNSSKLWLRCPMLDGSGGRRALIAEADARRIEPFSFVFVAFFSHLCCNGCIRPPLGSPLIHLRFGLVAFVNFDGDVAITPFGSERPSSQSEFFSLSESLLCILWYISGFCRTVVDAVLGVLGVASPRKPGRNPAFNNCSRSPRMNLWRKKTNGNYNRRLILSHPIRPHLPLEFIDAGVLVVVYPSDTIEMAHSSHIFWQYFGLWPSEVISYWNYIAIGCEGGDDFLKKKITKLFLKFAFRDKNRRVFLPILTR